MAGRHGEIDLIGRNYAENAENAATTAQFANHPPNCPASLRERGAELTFCVGGALA
jgi:hypothetical protein